MKKSILISILILIVLISVGIWAYLFIFGVPKNTDEVFAHFGIGGITTDAPVTTQNGDKITVTENSQPELHKKLRQLTTRPVAGATFDTTGIQYIEQGTGHLYHMNLESGEETLVSGTTIPKTTEALFSKDNSFIAITSILPEGNTTVVGKIVQSDVTGGTIEGVALPAGAREVAFGEATNTLNYLLTTGLGSTGYTYDILEKISTEVFSIPLRDVRVLWGTPLYVYTTPTGLADGFLYAVIKNELTYASSGGLGLMGFRYPSGIILTKTKDTTSASIALSNTGVEKKVSFLLIPEKCVSLSERDTLYCATPNNRGDELFPDDWYKGTLSYSDLLWSIDVTTGSALPLSDFKTESGREIDVIKIGINTTANYIWFINKNDNTLWMLDMTR